MTRADNKIAYLTSQGKCPPLCLKLLCNIINYFRFDLFYYVICCSIAFFFNLLYSVLLCFFRSVLFYFICSCLHFVNFIYTCVYSHCLNTSQKHISNLFIILLSITSSHFFFLTATVSSHELHILFLYRYFWIERTGFYGVRRTESSGNNQRVLTHHTFQHVRSSEKFYFHLLFSDKYNIKLGVLIHFIIFSFWFFIALHFILFYFILMVKSQIFIFLFLFISSSFSFKYLLSSKTLFLLFSSLFPNFFIIFQFFQSFSIKIQHCQFINDGYKKKSTNKYEISLTNAWTLLSYGKLVNRNLTWSWRFKVHHNTLTSFFIFMFFQIE